MPTISQNIQAVRDQIIAEPAGGPTGRRIGEQGIAALLNGIGTDEWRTYMENFATSAEQLDRLVGDDADFMAGEWGKQLLAYVVAGSPCMSGTEMSLVTEGLPQAMKDILDDGV